MRTTPRRLTAAAALALGLPLLVPGAAASAAPGPETGVLRAVVVEGPQERTDHVVVSGDRVLPTDAALPSGTAVTFRTAGEQAVDVAAVPGSTRPRATAARPPALAHVVHVVRALNPGQTADESISVAALSRAVREAGAYWTRETGSTVSFRVGKVASGWTRLARPCTDTAGAMEQGAKAVGLPADVPRGQHVLVVVPFDGRCLGVGTVGSDVHDGGAVVMGAGRDLASEGEVLPVSGLAHELGHNISLDHSGAVHCPGHLDPAFPHLDGCAVEEYGDDFDVMGPSGPQFGRGSLNVVNRLRLGVGAVTRVGGAGVDTTVTLDSLSRLTGARQGAAVTGTDGQPYFVEYRTDWGADSTWAQEAGSGSAGVRVLRPHPTMARRSLVLDMVADEEVVDEPTDWYQTLPTGRTFTSRSGAVRITVTAADARTATVRLQTAPFADAPGPAPAPDASHGSPQAPQDPGTPPPAAPSTAAPKLYLNTDRSVPFGTTVWATVVGRPGAPVDLYSRLYPNTGFTRIRYGLRLGADGSLVIPTAPNRNLRLLARYADDQAPSGQPLVQVATVTSVSRVSVEGRKVVFRGSSKPARAGQLVEVREGTRVLGAARTSSTGAYAVTFRRPGGCRQVAAVSVASGYNAASSSGAGTLCT